MIRITHPKYRPDIDGLLPDDLTKVIENIRAHGASFTHQISPK